MNSRRITLVLGMHRSGTSAIAGALHALGASLGGPVVPAADDNPRGYFEHAQAVEINESLLLGLGSGWDVPEPFPVEWLSTPAASMSRDAIRALLARDFAGDGWWVLKDPRLCRVLPLWLPLLAEAGFAVDAVLAGRSAPAVVASLVKRDRMDPVEALHLFLEHVLDMSRETGDLRRFAIDYDACLAAPEATLREAGRVLAWPVPDDESYARAAAMLDDGQRHHRGERIEGLDAVPAILFDDLARLAVDPGCDEARARLVAVRDAWRTQPVGPSLAGSRWALLRERRRLREALGDARGLRAAFGEAERAALERLASLRALDRQLAETQAGLADAERLSGEHLAAFQASAAESERRQVEIGKLHSEHAELQARMAALEDDRRTLEEAHHALSDAHHVLSDAHRALEEAHRTVVNSRSWRWTRPLRWITARLRGNRQ